MALYLLFGIALTGSRTAWIGVCILIVACWFWRSFWPWRKMPWIASALGVYFAAWVVVLGWIEKGDNQSMDLVRMTTELRPVAWRMFLDALSRRPLIGYGWNQTTLAQVAVAVDHPHIPGVFSYAHNLFLDLLLWCGIPLGTLVIIALIVWLWRRVRAVDSAETAILVLFLLVIGNHAMLELPLYYAYFLLPVGMVIGVLNVRLGSHPVVVLGRWSLACILMLCTLFAVILIRDYARVEKNYGIMRLEWQHIKVRPVGPPKVLLLTQWHDFMKYAKFEPKAGLSATQLIWMENVADYYPGALFFYKLATAEALNHRPQEARLALERMCKIVPNSDQLAVKVTWQKQALQSKEIASVPWPSDICK